MSSEKAPLLPVSPNGIRRVVVTESPSTPRRSELWPSTYAEAKSEQPTNHLKQTKSDRRLPRKSARDQKLSKLLESLVVTLAKGEKRLYETERKDMVKREWQQVALVVDRLLLVLFVALTVGVTMGLLIKGKIIAIYLFR